MQVHKVERLRCCSPVQAADAAEISTSGSKLVTLDRKPSGLVESSVFIAFYRVSPVLGFESFSIVSNYATCDPSQNGLLLDFPHRHSVTRLRTS